MGVRIPVGFGQISVEFHHALIPRPMVITFGIDAPASPDPSFIADEIAAMLTAANRPFLPSAMGTQYTLGPVKCSVQQELGVLTEYGTATYVGSNAAVTQLPPNNAMLVQKRSGVGGRGGRGRMYVPPVAFVEGDVDNAGLMTTTLRNTTNTQWANVLAALDLAGYGMWILHEGFGAPVQVTALNVERKLATQRQRLRA